MVILLIVVALLAIAALPRWPHSREWGYTTAVGLGVIALGIGALLFFYVV
ncbi:DUF3309 family protein [Silvibacterium acidisoli]